MTSSLYITVTAQVFFDEDDIDQIMEDENLTRDEAIKQYAVEAGFDLDSKDYSVKLRDVEPNLSTLK